MITSADLSDESADRARRELLGVTRGCGQNRDLFDENFPVTVSRSRAVLTHALTRVRYFYYDYWNELAGGSRLAVDAAELIRAGHTAFDVPNDRFIAAARAAADGAQFPLLILAWHQPTRAGLP